MSDSDVKEKEENVGQHDDLSVHPERQEAEEDELEKLYQLPSYSPTDDEIPYSEEPEKRSRLKKLLTKRVKRGGGAIGITLGIIFTIFSILQGPGEIGHFSHLLERFHFIKDKVLMHDRVWNVIEYGTTIDDPTARNLGYFGNVIANHYERSLKSIGIEPKFENRRIRYIDMNTATPEGQKAYEIMRDSGSKIEIDDKGIARVDFKGTTARQRRQAIDGMMNLLKINGVSSAVAKRLLKLRAAVSLHPWTNAVRRADETLLQFYGRMGQEKAQRRANGVDTTPQEASAAKAKPDAEGNIPPGEAEAESNRTTTASEANNILKDLRSELPFGGKRPELSARAKQVKANLARGVGLAGLVALTCNLQQLGDLVYDIRDANINQPLERIGTEYIAYGSQGEAMQDHNAEVMGATKADLFDEETQTSWASAASIQAELGQPITGPDLPLAAKPGIDRPAFLDVLDGTIGRIPGGAATCGGVTSTLGGFILDGAGWALNATGPIGFAVNASTDAVVGIGTGLLIDHIIQWLAGEQVTMDAAGALLGNQANYGAFLAANDVAIASGGVALSAVQSAQLDAVRNANIKKELQSKSLYARYFDISQPDSVAAKAVFENPSLHNPRAAFASIIGRPMSIFSGFANSLTPKASAVTRYDYGFPEFGFSLEEIDDPLYQDPFTNEAIITPRLATLNDRYKKCFHTTIDPTTFKIISGKAARYDEINNPANNCSNPGETFVDGSTELKRYRYYLADMVSAKSMACYEGLDEESCTELGFGVGQTSTDSSSGGSNSLPQGDIKGVAQQLLASPNVIWGDPTARQQAQAVADTGSGEIDHLLIRVLAGLAQNHKFAISSLKRCTSGIGAGVNSLHCIGKAVDISGDIDGVAVGYNGYDKTTQKFLDDAAALLPGGCEIGVPNNQYVGATQPKASDCDVFLDIGTAAHIHLGVPS